MDGDLAAMDALNALKEFEKLHHLDPNLPLEELIEIDAALDGANPEKGIEIEQILTEDNSPYPEVGYPAFHPSCSRQCMAICSVCLPPQTENEGLSNIVMSRFEHRCGTTMSRYQSTQSARGR